MGRRNAFFHTFCLGVLFLGAACSGCASAEGTLLEDSVWGDLETRLSPNPRYTPSSTVSAPAFYPDLAPPAQPPTGQGVKQ